MIRIRRVLLFLLFLILSNSLVVVAEGNPGYNLMERWMVYEDNQYRPFTDDDNGLVSTIYIFLEANEYRGVFMEVQSSFAFSLFVNGQLAAVPEKSFLLMNVDSLRAAFHKEALAIAIHQDKIHFKSLSTRAVNVKPVDQSVAEEDIDIRPSTYFRDFVLISSLILLGMLVIIIRLNPKLTGDYFSVSRIFSLRESDDSQLNSRITSSSNILFYTYCSLIVSFYLMVIFHFVSIHIKSAWLFQADTFGMAVLQWLKLSFFLLAIFFAKIFLIYLFTRLFALHDIFGLHVFNWIRLMLIFFGALSVFLIIYHIMRGQNEGIYSIFMWAIVWILSIWVLIVFPKVMHRASYSLFHIFSYICATEIIPLLISIKIIYY